MGFWEFLSTTNYRYLVAGTSFVAFTLNSRYILNRIAPSHLNAKENAQTLWKWKNTANSLLHSFVSGTWAVINLWRTPELRFDLINTLNGSTFALISLTVGYFIYDFFDLFGNRAAKNRLGLLVHHILVSICFGLCIYTMKYHGYGMFALIVEINSIFLHIRQLMIILNHSRENFSYKLNSALNMVTFFIFRLLSLFYLTYWLYKNQKDVDRSVVYLGFLTNTAIVFLNLAMLRQIITKDYMLPTKVKL